MKPAVIVAAACAAVAVIQPASAGGGWRTEVVSDVVAARDPGWPVVVQRFRQPPAVIASLPRPSAATPSTPPSRGPHRLEGLASFYWQAQTTASGEHFDRRQLTAAHPTLPFNTLVRVQNPVNGRSVIVRINDRGPFKPGRIIDLAEAAADQIGMRKAGIARVKLEVLPAGRMTAGL